MAVSLSAIYIYKNNSSSLQVYSISHTHELTMLRCSDQYIKPTFC
jgi:hypothetical protein